MFVLVSLVLGCAAMTSLTFAADMSCANEARRVEQGTTYLPACRAYELVTPPGAAPGAAQAAIAGGGVAWTSHLPPRDEAGQIGGQVFLSRRGATGWSTLSATPPQSPEAAGNLNCAPSMYFSPNLARGVLSDGFGSASLAGDGQEPCVARNEPSLVTEPSGWQSEPEGFQNLFFAEVTENGPGAWRLVNRTRSSVAPSDAWLEDASTAEGEELSHVVFEEGAQLTEDAPVGDNLYEWFDGEVRLVTFLPDGQPVVGELANGTAASEAHVVDPAAFTHAVSTDGSRVFFTAEGSLYVRLHADSDPHQGALEAAECVDSKEACTIQVDASQAGGPGGGATFLTANASGTKVFFLDSAGAELTSDTEAASGENLYEYEVDTGRLIDLTGGDAEAGVLGYSGFGEEPSGAYHLYFAAEGALAGSAATPGRPNLYAASERNGARQTEYIATLNPEEDTTDWGTSREAEGGVSSLELLRTRVSPDGRLIIFTSTEAEAIAGFDNMPAQPEACSIGAVANGSHSGACREIFRYEAGAGQAECVSCRVGASPEGPSVIDPPSSVQDRRGPASLGRQVDDDGTVFFDSPNALVPEDVNGVGDVYEYRAGAARLVSSGASTGVSTFLDASVDGMDVFFTTSQRLLGADATDGLSLYDARREGGFVEPAQPAECGAGGCRTTSSAGPIVSPTPASLAFTGPGNIAATNPTASAKTGKPRPLTRKQRLSRALKACKRRANKRRRAQCERLAERKYGPRRSAAHHAKPSIRGRGGAK
ncbi:MAG TPA: hypothetical protein VK774_09750 [Solirubrobacteraceae bacterium]|nr:hypothetical protein [Solirubrobacteraceae bacterium]